ncbi:hypothetical protein HK405_007055 [Cladochytrium tenue]|nr:hypothetical protein HK405_007055 [Cladochytrium tenue]
MFFRTEAPDYEPTYRPISVFEVNGHPRVSTVGRNNELDHEGVQRALNFARAMSEVVFDGSFTVRRALVVYVADYFGDVEESLSNALPEGFNYRKLLWRTWKRTLDSVAPGIEVLLREHFDAVPLGECHDVTLTLAGEEEDDDLAADLANLRV